MTADYECKRKERKTTFGATVQKVRGILLITQKELAVALNVSPVTINRWEKGKVEPSFLSKKQFIKYCEEQGLTIQSDMKQIIEYV